METNKKQLIGLIDADLIDKGTRHPNLLLLKLAGFFKDQGIPYSLIYENGDISKYTTIFQSKVFTKTREPEFLHEAKCPVYKGGTGYYADLPHGEEFEKARSEDMTSLYRIPILNGLNLKRQMPDYNLYNEYISSQEAKGADMSRYKDYRYFSIGNLTKGCIRKCSFCVNQNLEKVYNYSDVFDFIDPDRPMIYLADDNFLASPNWKPLLEKLNALKKPFQFKQGLDIRCLTEEKAEMLAKSRYRGDYIFAFDRIEDKDLITRKLSMWMKYNKPTKLYLLCGFQINSDDSLFTDLINLFERIKILMQFGCTPFVMKHSDFLNHPLSNIYVQVARWCNQPQFFRKMSFHEFIQRNLHYSKTGKCKPMETYIQIQNLFQNKLSVLNPYFHMKAKELRQL